VTRFELVPQESTATIAGRSSLHPIHSRVAGLSGTLACTFADGHIDTAQPVTGSISLPVQRLESSNPLETRELRRRIDARRHPTIDGVLTLIVPGDTPGTYQVTGDITFRGATRTYTGLMTIELVDDVVHLRGRATFDIRDHGMEPPRIAMLKVEPTVEVEVSLVAAVAG
jgi:polyisoprenoid-binding protein YceI